MTTRIFIDTETTSVRYDRRVWDVGIVQYSDSTRKEHSWLVADVDLSGADTRALEVGHFRDRHPLAGARVPDGTEALPERDVAHEVFRLVFDATIAGVVVDFDTYGLDAMLRRHNLSWPGYHHLLCVENRALGMLQGHATHLPEVFEEHRDLLTRANDIPGRWKTEEIAAAFGIPEMPENERHTAIGDARLAERIYHAAIIDQVVPVPGVRWPLPSAMLPAT